MAYGTGSSTKYLICFIPNTEPLAPSAPCQGSLPNYLICLELLGRDQWHLPPWKSVAYGTGSWPKSQPFSRQGSALVPSHIGIFSPSGFLMALDPHSKTAIILCLALDYPHLFCFGNWYRMHMALALHQNILSTLCQDGTLTVGTFSRSTIGAKAGQRLPSLPWRWCHLAPATHQTPPSIWCLDVTSLTFSPSTIGTIRQCLLNRIPHLLGGQHLCYSH